jgi:hypothetical protein
MGLRVNSSDDAEALETCVAQNLVAALAVTG